MHLVESYKDDLKLIEKPWTKCWIALTVIALGIALFKGGYNTPYPEQLAVSVIACLPLVVLYIFLSKYFVQGIAMTGIKG